MKRHHDCDGPCWSLRSHTYRCRKVPPFPSSDIHHGLVFVDHLLEESYLGYTRILYRERVTRERSPTGEDCGIFSPRRNLPLLYNRTKSHDPSRQTRSNGYDRATALKFFPLPSFLLRHGNPRQWIRAGARITGIVHSDRSLTIRPVSGLLLDASEAVTR